MLWIGWLLVDWRPVANISCMFRTMYVVPGTSYRNIWCWGTKWIVIWLTRTISLMFEGSLSYKFILTLAGALEGDSFWYIRSTRESQQELVGNVGDSWGGSASVIMNNYTILDKDVEKCKHNSCQVLQMQFHLNVEMLSSDEILHHTHKRMY